MINSFNPDLIHVNFSGYTAFFQQNIARNHSIPTLLALHGDLTGQKTGPGTILGQLLQNADWVTTVSKAVLWNACQFFPEIAERSSIIYPCTEPPSILPTPLPFNRPCIIGIGRLVHEKGFDVLLDSIPAIAEQFPDISVKLIGNGPERFSLEQKTNRLGLKEKVEFTGSIPNELIPVYINKAIAVIIPSRYQEAFGIVSLEAAIMGRPVVATNVCGLAETIIQGETGLLIEMENSAALAEAIITLLSQPQNTARLGAAARARALHEFSVSNYVEEYDQLYRRLIIKPA